jgi:hypothetical protein
VRITLQSMASAKAGLVRGSVNGQGQMHARSTFHITSNARANSKQNIFTLRRSDIYAPTSRVRVQNQYALLRTGGRSNAAWRKPSVTTFAISKQAHHSSEQSSLSGSQKNAQEKAKMQDDKEKGQETEATGHEVGDEAGGIRDAQEGIRDELRGADEKLEKIHNAGMAKDQEEERVEKRVKDRRAGAWS